MVSKEVSDPFYLFLRGWLEQTELGQQFMKDVKNNPRDYKKELAEERGRASFCKFFGGNAPKAMP